jgi:hypothetical protein
VPGRDHPVSGDDAQYDGDSPFEGAKQPPLLSRVIPVSEHAPLSPSAPRHASTRWAR